MGRTPGQWDDFELRCMELAELGAKEPQHLRDALLLPQNQVTAKKKKRLDRTFVPSIPVRTPLMPPSQVFMSFCAPFLLVIVIDY